MSIDTREARLERRIADLYSDDAQFAAAKPDEAVSAAANDPGLRLPDVVRTVLEGYADRPALGQRAVEYVTDASGRTTAKLQPRFDTVTYGQLWDRVQAFGAALRDQPVRPGDRVAILGFTSVDYTVVDTALTQLGAVSVPLQTSAPHAQLQPIIAETEPVLIASSIDYVDDAVELDPAPGLRPRDWSCSTTGPRSTTTARPSRRPRRASDSAVAVETLAEVLDRGRDASRAAGPSSPRVTTRSRCSSTPPAAPAPPRARSTRRARSRTCGASPPTRTGVRTRARCPR